MEPLDFIDFKSFWSIWYWIFSVVTWSMSSHWTLGVPFDMVIRADRKGGEFADQCDDLIAININRMLYYFELGGVYFAAILGFILAVIATLAFLFKVEVFAAIFMLAFPMAIVSGFSIRFAYRARQLEWSGAVLRRKVRHRRMWNQVIGMLATIAAVMMAVYYYFESTNAYWPGFP